MLISFNELKKYPLVFFNSDEDSHELSDILFDGESGTLANFVYEEQKRESAENRESYTDKSFEMVEAMGSSVTGTVGSLPQSEGLPREPKKHVQYFFIDAKAAIIEDSKIHYKGSVKGEGAVKDQLISVSDLIRRRLTSEEDQQIGKVKDIMIDIDQKAIKGLKISEGFWERLVGEGMKYLPASAIVKWYPEPLIVKEPADKYLLDSEGDLDEKQ
ncbi:PRC-barrel domain protein [Scopulibacillus darangshiensis]|uniref:PRC-barrel domain protein n=1 Tax=Scopulibacillus darangshiensis TaxID=442528 RepID=A0A4R2NYQ0_9BACL|nr:PRC-barrel domain-containing protein [Scopulibacillus darangshiensis]TCP26651.1 PRC-barrel domain protein [Scopulibacillus darangshiensis]